MNTPHYSFRLTDKHIQLIDDHRATLGQTRERKVTRTEALEDILNKFKEPKPLSPIEKINKGLEAFIHG